MLDSAEGGYLAMWCVPRIKKNRMDRKMKLAIYPGSFDPFTNGHKNILQQACRLFDKVIVAVATDNYKQSLFTTTERQQMIAAAVTDLPGVEVEIFEGLLADFVCQKQAQGHCQKNGIEKQGAAFAHRQRLFFLF